MAEVIFIQIGWYEFMHIPAYRKKKLLRLLMGLFY